MWAWFSGLSLASKSTITLALLAIIAVSMAVCMRNCRKIWVQPEPKPPKVTEYEVVEVLSGASILCKHRRREVVVYLQDIAAPAEGEPYFAESRDNLKLIAGSMIKVERERRRILFRGTEGESLPEQADSIEARGPIEGIAYGSTNQCLQVEQLEAGWASVTGDDAPKAWNTAEREARKKNKGMWSEQ
jgi:endonuclease YncB( thermonuclease family)